MLPINVLPLIISKLTEEINTLFTVSFIEAGTLSSIYNSVHAVEYVNIQVFEDYDSFFFLIINYHSIENLK